MALVGGALEGLPLDALRSAALEGAQAAGASHAEVRVERICSQLLSLRDGQLETVVDDVETGMGLRVVRNGAIGFAATVELVPEAAAELSGQAAAMADATAGALARPVDLADEPSHGTR